MPTNLLEGFVSITIKEDEVRAKLAKTESGFRQSVKRIDEETKTVGKSFDALAGKAGGIGEAAEHGILHGFGHLGRMLGAGGLTGLLAMEGVHMGMEFLESANGAEKMAESVKELTKYLKDYDEQSNRASFTTQKLIENSNEAVNSGRATRKTALDMMREFDRQSEETKQRMEEKAKKLAETSDAEAVKKFMATDEGKLWDKKARADMAKDPNTAKLKAPNIFTDPIEAALSRARIQAAREAMQDPLDANDLADLKKQRKTILEKFHLDPKLYGEDANPFLREEGRGGGFHSLEDFGKGIQEGLLSGDRAATQDEQAKQTAVLEKIEEKLPAIPAGAGFWH
jgi:hypothetical protein